MVPGQPLSQNDAWKIVTMGRRGPNLETVAEELQALLPPVAGDGSIQLPRESYVELHALLEVLRAPKGHATLAMTTEGKEYKARVARMVEMMRPAEWDRANEYIVDAVYYFDSMRPDLDGPGKLILDAMEDFSVKLGTKEYSFTGLYKNDRQVWDFRQRRVVDRQNPRAEITVRLRKPWKPQQRSLL